ncbi:hypothetical protein ACJX0J_011211, partial [Zea mays]
MGRTRLIHKILLSTLIIKTNKNIFMFIDLFVYHSNIYSVSSISGLAHGLQLLGQIINPATATGSSNYLNILRRVETGYVTFGWLCRGFVLEVIGLDQPGHVGTTVVDKDDDEPYGAAPVARFAVKYFFLHKRIWIRSLHDTTKGRFDGAALARLGQTKR